MRRRLALRGLAGLGLASRLGRVHGEEAVLLEALRQGGAVLMLRHARTEPGVGDPQTAALQRALARLPAQGFEAWVTHQVNITALTGACVDMGEAVVLRGGPDGGTMLGRLSLGA